MNLTHNEYGWMDGQQTQAGKYVLPAVLNYVKELSSDKSLKVLDIGCGNGYVAGKLAQQGHSVVGIDVSPEGIEIARSAYSHVQFSVCSIYDNELADVVIAPVDCVVALEVVEHLFYPKRLFEQSHKILKKGGHIIISTPYHGYLKNLTISLLNGWDRHFKVWQDGGHIKFFSEKTLVAMASNAGFKDPCFQGAGRFPGLWKSMILVMSK